MFVGIVVFFVAILGIRVVPEVIEYGKIVSAIKAMAEDPSLKQASTAEIRNAFDRRANTGYISELTGKDIDVARNGNTLVLSVSYTKRIHLGGPVSLLIDFEASTDK
jgi:hypothetical protein